MKFRIGRKILTVTMSILIGGAGILAAETDEPGPFERLFRAMRRGMSEPQHHKSTSHQSSHKKQATESQTSSTEEPTVQPTTSTGNNKPPNERNTRSATRASRKKGDDLRYGIPVPGRKGFVTSPFSPDAGYIDVRGFAPGTAVKDPYTGKIFLTP